MRNDPIINFLGPSIGFYFLFYLLSAGTMVVGLLMTIGSDRRTGVLGRDLPLMLLGILGQAGLHH